MQTYRKSQLFLERYLSRKGGENQLDWDQHNFFFVYLWTSLSGISRVLLLQHIKRFSGTCMRDFSLIIILNEHLTHSNTHSLNKSYSKSKYLNIISVPIISVFTYFKLLMPPQIGGIQMDLQRYFPRSSFPTINRSRGYVEGCRKDGMKCFAGECCVVSKV